MSTDAKTSLHAVIFTGGMCQSEFLAADDLHGDLVIAADAGWLLAQKCGVRPDIIVGDFDSSPVPVTDEETEILRVPVEKDDTDTTLACNIAIERGAREILLIGGTGGRLDHTLSNVFLLERLHRRGIRLTLTDGTNRARILENESVSLPKAQFTYFSLLSLGASVISLAGCKYPLENAPLTRTDLYAVSNEITSASAAITVAGDPVLLIESDAHSL